MVSPRDLGARQFVRKKKVGPSKSSTKTTFIFTQQNSKSKDSRNKTKDVYNYCKELSHWAQECKKRSVDWKKKNEQNMNNVLEVSDEAKSGEVFMFALSISSRFGMWYIDFGVSTHLSHECNWFTNYEFFSPIKIYVGNNSILEVIRKRNIHVLMSMGENEGVEVVFTNVLHVLGIINFILFITKATSLGHVDEFGKNDVSSQITKKKLWHNV